MPIVHIDIIEGRSVEKRKKMVKRVAEVIHEAIECPMDAIKIVVNEMRPEDISTRDGVTWDDLPEQPYEV